MQELTKLRHHFVRIFSSLIGLCFIIMSLHSCFFDKEIKQDTEISDFRNTMLRILDSLDTPQARIKAYESLLQEVKDDKYIITERKKNNLLIDGLFYISEEYYKLQNFDKAIEFCNEALKLNAQSAGAYYNRGLAYQAKDDLQIALSDYTKAIDLDADYSNAYYNRGLVYEKLKDYNKALLDYDQALKLKPVYMADIYIGRGNVYRGLNDPDKAIESYDKALSADSLNIEAYSNRGSLFAEVGKYEEALTDYARAIRIDSTNADLYNRQAYTFELMQDYTSAIDSYNEVVKLDPRGKGGYKKLAKEGIDRVKALKRKSRK